MYVPLRKQPMKYLYIVWTSFIIVSCIGLLYPQFYPDPATSPAWLDAVRIALFLPVFFLVIPIGSYLGALSFFAKYKKNHKFLLSLLFSLAHTFILYAIYFMLFVTMYGIH